MYSETAASTSEEDNFKAIFKKYKRRDQKLDLSAVVDVNKQTDNKLSLRINLYQSRISSHTDEACEKQAVLVKPNVPASIHICGLKPAQQWKIYHFTHRKGFYVIRDPFLPGYQRYWVSRCLQDLPPPPSVTNLRIHPDIDPGTVWSQFLDQHKTGKPFDNSSPLRKLRWTTMGYHHDWETRVYREEHRTPLPQDVALLSQYVAEVMGFSHFQPEAGVINYYHLDSALGGHVDYSELDHQAPLISFSFGQSAVFLLGGQTKATEPTPILLRSGDVCVMSGPSRLAYHAVPRILQPPVPAPPECFLFSASAADRESVGDGDQDGAGSKRRELSLEKSSPHILADDESRNRDEKSRDTKAREQSLQNAAAQTCGGVERCERTCGAEGIETSHPESGQEALHASSIDARLVGEVNGRMQERMQSLDWGPFASYLSSTRLNMNVRQVLKLGQTFQSHAPQEVGVQQGEKLCADKEASRNGV